MPQGYSLARAQEARESRRREQEYKVQAIDSYYAEMKAQEAGFSAMQHDDVQRRRRENMERQREYAMLENMYKSKQETSINRELAEDAERMATAVEMKQKGELRKNMEIQQLMEGSEELRELQIKINAAKMNKERTMQLREKELLEEQERQYREQFDAYMEEELQRANANQAENDRARTEALVKQRMVLEEQIQEKQEASRLAQIEFEKEKELVDAIARKIEEEDVKDMMERREKQQRTKQFIDEFNEEQERLRFARREEEREEERRIEDYAAYKRQIEQEEEDRKNAKKEEADRKYHKLKLEMEEEMRRLEEEERLINILREEEQVEKAKAAAAAKSAREERLRAEMMAANEEMKAIKVQRAEEERMEEERFRQMLLAKFAEDERIEQMNAQRRRMKQQEHKREVERLISEKRRMYEEFKANELLAFQAERAEDDRKAAIVEEQRQRLLREAAELGLAEYLPKGIIREDDDLKVFGIQKTRPTLQTIASMHSRGG